VLIRITHHMTYDEFTYVIGDSLGKNLAGIFVLAVDDPVQTDSINFSVGDIEIC